MNAYPSSLGQLPAPNPPRKNYWVRTGGKFFILSILAHVIFGLGAAYYVIHIFTPPRKPLQAVIPAANAAVKDEEQKTQLRKLQEATSAPATPMRVTSAGPAEVIFPPLPEIPETDAVAIAPMINGQGLTGFQPGPGGPGTSQSGNSGHSAPTNFGADTYIPGTLKGTFYDLKLTPGKRNTGMTFDKYAEAVTGFVKGNWNEGLLTKYLKGARPLYATQVFFPEIESTEGPAAFHSPAPDSPGMWVVVYKGLVSPPESGTYHFVGAGDDDMIVRFNGKLVLDKCEHINPQIPSEGIYHYPGLRNEFGRGLPVTVEAGQFYEIEILIGDHIPTKTMAVLLIEKEGVNYEKAGGAPILPAFSLAPPDKSQPVVPAATLPPHVENGPVWRGKSAAPSFFDDVQ